MVSFLWPFFLSMCNVRMCSSLSTILLFVIMTYDATAFQQDERRRRKREQNVECRKRKKSKKQILWCIIGIRYILVVVMKEILMDTRRWRRWWGFYLPSRNVDVHECTCDRRCRGQNRWNPPWITNTIWKIKFIFHIVFVIHGGLHLFCPLQRLSHTLYILGYQRFH